MRIVAEPRPLRIVNAGVRRLLPFCTLAPILLGSAYPPDPAAPPRAAQRAAAAAPPVAAADSTAADLLFAADAAPLVTSPPAPEKAVPAVPDASAPAPPAIRATAPALDADRPRVRVLVSIPQQKLYAFKGEDVLMIAPVSTGKRGYETPAGTFPILQKKVHHRSSTYDNAPMPYMQRLTWKGVALHAGRLPGYPASHGCIGLSRKSAKKLYGLTSFDTIVTITHDRPASSKEALQLLRT